MRGGGLTRTRWPVAVGLLGFALAAAGCVSLKRTPEARFFVLESQAGPRPAATGQAPAGVVGVETARLPDHLARPQLVTWTAANELRIDEFLRWAEPLDTGVTRTLAEDLAALLPDQQVVQRPWPGHTRTRCRVLLSVHSFGPQPDGRVTLEGRWSLLPDRGGLALARGPVSLQRGPLASGGENAPPATGVDLMSELISDVSRQIADAIRGLPPEPPSEAPAQPAGTADR